jgi:membrane-associated phospholipid phosphatase
MTTHGTHPEGRADARAVPVLDREPGPVGRRLSGLAGRDHPVWTFLSGVLLSWAAVAALSILFGLLVKAAVQSHGVANADESLVTFLSHHRDRVLTDASLVGSIIAGGVVLPIIAAVWALVWALFRHWRLAAFIPFALGVESGSYRATTLVVHRHRPTVPRLENLPVNASYPSGHTAAAIAVYCGIALLATSRIKNTKVRVAIWTIAPLIPVYVAFARMYRGMHHPLDVAGGVAIGIATLIAMVVIDRASRSAALKDRP